MSTTATSTSSTPSTSTQLATSASAPSPSQSPTQSTAHAIATRVDIKSRIMELLPPLSADQQSTLRSWDDCVRRASFIARSATMVIAYYGWRISKSNRWAEFGVTDQYQYAAQRDIDKAEWDKCMQIGQALEPLTFEQLCTIPVQSAKAITNVLPGIWFDYPWLEEARTLSVAQFLPLVRERNRIHKGWPVQTPRLPSPPRPRPKTDKQPMPPMPMTVAAPIHPGIDPLDLTLPAGSKPGLLAASRHTYKLINLVIQSMRKYKRKSPKITDDIRILTKARERIGGGIKQAVHEANEANKVNKVNEEGKHEIGPSPVHPAQTGS